MASPLTVCGALDLSHKRKKSLDSQFIAKLCHKNIIFEKVQTIVMAFNLHPCYICVLYYFCRMGLRGKAIFKFAKFIYKKRPLYDCTIRSTTCVLWETWTAHTLCKHLHSPSWFWMAFVLLIILYYILSSF